MSLTGQVSSLLKEGEELIAQNEPNRAIPKLEAAINQNPAAEKGYLYLGIAYEQTGQRQKAVEVFRRGAALKMENQAVLYYNMGNNLYALGNYREAVDAYNKAALADPDLADVYLNRAGGHIKVNNYQAAVSDYRLFLELRPADPQADKIRQAIGILERIKAEEEARLAEEKRRKEAEEARQRALLQQVLDSLKTAQEDTTNISAESEGIELPEDDLELAD